MWVTHEHKGETAHGAAGFKTRLCFVHSSRVAPRAKRDEIIASRGRALQRCMASKRAREIDLHDLLTSPLSSLTRLPGSGDEQAPKLVELLCSAGLKALWYW